MRQEPFGPKIRIKQLQIIVFFCFANHIAQTQTVLSEVEITARRTRNHRSDEAALTFLR